MILTFNEILCFYLYRVGGTPSSPNTVRMITPRQAEQVVQWRR